MKFDKLTGVLWMNNQQCLNFCLIFSHLTAVCFLREDETRIGGLLHSDVKAGNYVMNSVIRLSMEDTNKSGITRISLIHFIIIRRRVLCINLATRVDV